jgi:hypothetical protein
MGGIIRGKVTQTGVDTFTIGAIDTNLTIDGKAGWLITKMTCFWEDGYTAAAADQTISGILATQATVTTPSDNEELARVNWAVANTAGVAVAYPMELQKSVSPPVDRITAQPAIYFQVSSTGTGLANDVYYEVEYEIVKLTDIEVLRLLVGGA